ncbi:hypothetical protein CTI12_AA355660 [Artemisia annua]|uniref:FLZ-type domain-containing protein n=1 Tax=Artemisia annua TaxID=35608 RepID=A0A2U1MPF6_ARTAN|nr:hypothetical protein CTI12_AA355660 [Artemisia annua]
MGLYEGKYYSPRFGGRDRFGEPQPHFLDNCFLSKKMLGHNRDIFMYRQKIMVRERKPDKRDNWKPKIPSCTEKLSSSASAMVDRLRDAIGSWFGGKGSAPRSMHKNGGKRRLTGTDARANDTKCIPPIIMELWVHQKGMGRGGRIQTGRQRRVMVVVGCRLLLRFT